MFKRKITLSEYNIDWPDKFDAEKTLITNALDDCVIDCFHIGSTSVPGLMAKPIIDMLLIVTSLRTLDDRQSALETIGYISKGENGLAKRRYFYKGKLLRRFHLHAFEPRHPDIVRHLAFRDYLREQPEITIEYQKIKKLALINGKGSAEFYANFKDPFIKKHEAIALEIAEKSKRYDKI